VDVPGVVLSAGAMALLVFTIIEAPANGRGSARSVAGFAVSAALLAAFIVGEQSSRHPMLDVRLFRNPRFSVASGAVTVAFFTLLGFIFLITQYFQFIRGYGPLSTGVHLLPVALAVGAAYAVSGRVSAAGHPAVGRGRRSIPPRAAPGGRGRPRRGWGRGPPRAAHAVTPAGVAGTGPVAGRSRNLGSGLLGSLIGSVIPFGGGRRGRW
jgi:hypothetical protein